ncbi:MAG: hypothetical protein HOC63_10345 [Rhodospirillales bacterium]|jgi:hypothetical protein|nr:hypothetical protein [Rhodospirillales bacterium]
MAIFGDLIELDHKLTNRSTGTLNTRGLRSRDGGMLPKKGHGTSAAHYTPLETANYIITSLTTFVPASQVANEVKAFTDLHIDEVSHQNLVKDNKWHIQDGKVPRELNNFQWALAFFIELAGDPERLSGKGWEALDRMYVRGTLTLRKSVDTREAIIQLEPTSKKGQQLIISYSSPVPATRRDLYPVYESVTVSLSFVAEFGVLLAGASND